MVYQPKRFDVSGPSHLLTCFDWRNTIHRRSLAASLVQGVYSLERERQQGVSFEHEQYSSPWWKRFKFQLNRNGVLEDKSDSSYFGAIYELESAHPFFYESSPNPPKYVIAFRGTITTTHTGFEDMKLNLKGLIDKLASSSRFRTAFKAVWGTVGKAGPANVWLAGHSLGASIAMLAGRNMVKHGFYLETYLFNPPFISAPIERMIKNKKLELGVRIVGSFTKATVAKVMNRYGDNLEKDPFIVLWGWMPHVCVNPSDDISLKYIGYFKHREKMDKMFVGNIESIATRVAFRSLVSGAIGRALEPLHIIPSAYMTVNHTPSENFRQAHGIDQWWQPDCQWEPKPYTT